MDLKFFAGLSTRWTTSAFALAAAASCLFPANAAAKISSGNINEHSYWVSGAHRSAVKTPAQKMKYAPPHIYQPPTRARAARAIPTQSRINSKEKHQTAALEKHRLATPPHRVAEHKETARAITPRIQSRPVAYHPYEPTPQPAPTARYRIITGPENNRPAEEAAPIVGVAPPPHLHPRNQTDAANDSSNVDGDSSNTDGPTYAITHPNITLPPTPAPPVQHQAARVVSMGISNPPPIVYDPTRASAPEYTSPATDTNLPAYVMPTASASDATPAPAAHTGYIPPAAYAYTHYGPPKVAPPKAESLSDKYIPDADPTNIEQYANATPLYAPHLSIKGTTPLYGSHEILLHQNEMADVEGLNRIQNDAELNRMRRNGQLMPLPISYHLAVDPRLPANRRYCRPWTAKFLSDISAAFYNRFGEPLQVNSAVRTVEVQEHLERINGNAAPAEGTTASPHLTGAAVDITKHNLTPAQIKWMREYLVPIEDVGKIDVEEEFQQAVFHISVYKLYAPPTVKRAVPHTAARAESVSQLDLPQ